MKMATWKSAETLGFSKYSVSTNGEVKNNKTGVILAPQKKADGYMRLNLYDNDGKPRLLYVHGLMGKLFLGNDGSKTVDHIDGVRSNNNLSNLRLATKKEQRANTKPLEKRQGKRVQQLTLDGDEIKVWDTVLKAAEGVGAIRGTIRAACQSLKPSKGYLWRYYDEIDKEGEIWKSSDGIFPEYEPFEASSLGRIRKNGKTVDGYKRGGYMSVKIRCSTTGKHLARQVHVLVLGCFEGTSDLTVNHKDGKKENNKIENLEYMTQSEQMIHSWHSLRSLSTSNSVVVHQYTVKGDFVERFLCIEDAARKTGAKISCIGAVIKGNRLTAGGFYWEKAW